MERSAEEIGRGCWRAVCGRSASYSDRNTRFMRRLIYRITSQRGTTHSVPNLIHYLLGLLLEAENVPTGRPTWSAASTRPKVAKNLSARYLALHSVFKLEIVAFLCELTMQTGVIRDYYDQAALALSKCRNDQNANKRELAKMYVKRGTASKTPRADLCTPLLAAAKSLKEIPR